MIIHIAEPIISILAVLEPFFKPKTSMMSFKNGKKATNKTDGEINRPIKVTEAKRKATKNHGPLAAILLVIKKIVQRLTKLVLERG